MRDQISLRSALALKRAGLEWQPSDHDVFAVPFEGLEDWKFVLAGMTAEIRAPWFSDLAMEGEDFGALTEYGQIAFNGAAEWSLDYIARGDVVWLPRLDQLLEAMKDRFVALHRADETWVVQVASEDGSDRFVGHRSRSEAAARSLHQILIGN